MPEKSANKTRTNRFTQPALVLVFCVALLKYIQNIQRQEIIPYLPTLLLLALVGGAIVSLLQPGRQPLRDLFKTPLFLALNAFGLVALLSTAYSIYPSLTFSRSLQFIIVVNSLYLVLWCTKDIKRVFEAVGTLLIYFVLIAAIYGLILRYFGSVEWVYTYHPEHLIITDAIKFNYLNTLGIELTQLLYDDRISSFTGNPNTIGFLIMVSSLISIYFVVEKKKYHYLIYIAISLYVLLLAHSRASILGLATGLFKIGR